MPPRTVPAKRGVAAPLRELEDTSDECDDQESDIDAVPPHGSTPRRPSGESGSAKRKKQEQRRSSATSSTTVSAVPAAGVRAAETSTFPSVNPISDDEVKARFKKLRDTVSELGPQASFALICPVKLLGGLHRFSSDRYMTEVTRMIMFRDELSHDRLGNESFPFSFRLGPGENDEDDAPAKTQEHLLADLQVQVLELAHGQRAALIAQSVNTVCAVSDCTTALGLRITVFAVRRPCS